MDPYHPKCIFRYPIYRRICAINSAKCSHIEFGNIKGYQRIPIQVLLLGYYVSPF